MRIGVLRYPYQVADHFNENSIQMDDFFSIACLYSSEKQISSSAASSDRFLPLMALAKAKAYSLLTSCIVGVFPPKPG